MSFIGLEHILDRLIDLAGDEGRIVALVKPQFEAGRAEANHGRGVIRDPEIWKRVLGETASAARGRGLAVGGLCVSPIKGGAGNVEFFFLLGAAAGGFADVVDRSRVDRVVTEAGELP